MVRVRVPKKPLVPWGAPRLGSTWGSAGPAAPFFLEPTLALRGSRGQGWVFRGRPRPPYRAGPRGGEHPPY